MNVLITGAAGNLGSHLASRMLSGPHDLRLLIHHKPLPPDIANSPRASVFRADLGRPETLLEVCRGVDCIVHFAGLLFAPNPERFLPRTNVEYVQNLVEAALRNDVKKFILISFPHVEGESGPERPATGRFDGNPSSVHARTRLAAEKYLFKSAEGTQLAPVALRPGMIYARGVLMIEAARWLLRRNLMAVWPKPTWIHLLALPDFLDCVVVAIEGAEICGVYNLGDDQPLTLQQFLDATATHWGFRKPWRFPEWSFYFAGWCCETFARLFGTPSPLTRDFIRIGMAPYVSDTSRMKAELLPRLAYPTLGEGLQLL